ncbi:MAG: tetratricopeptide repeat protein [Spirochaetales bacterium]|nr:tetratricopeptide repeat protein [Spirochaetales bacterium]
MQKELKDIRFITLPDERKIGDVTIRSDIPIPVQFPQGSVTDDIDFNSIVAGLIKIVAWDPENKDIEYYKKLLLELQPDVIKELNLAAIAKSNKKEFEFAEELMLAVNHLSDAPESYINLAVLYAQMTVELHKKNDDTKADMYDDKIIAILNECKSRHEKYAATYSEISAFHMRHGDIESARDYLAKYTELEKDKKKREQAQSTLKSIEKMLSSKDQIMYAYDKMMMGCADDALEIMDKYIASNEKRWESFFLRGWAKRVLEDYSGAQKDLLESIRIDGKNAEVYNELSICARESGDTELAKSYLQIAVDLDGDDVIYLSNLAFLHLASGEFEESRELLEKARKIDPEDPQLKYLIEEYEKQTGDEIGQIISEDVYSDEDIEELKNKNSGIPYKEI